VRIHLIPDYATAIAVEPTTDERVIALDDVAIARGGRTVLDVGSLRIGPGLTVLVGPNGSGKSTLLHAVAGLLDVVAGRVTVLGATPVAARPRVAYVLQAQQLPEGLLVTVREVVALARAARLGPFRRFRPVDHDAVDAALERLELTDLAGRHLVDLSGGQRQRVFLAQGVAQEAEVLLLDEPVAGLDLTSSERIAAVIDDERRHGRIVVVATHDLDEAGRADQAVLLAGRVVAAGPPSTVIVAANLRDAYGGRLVDLGDGRFLTDDDEAHDHAH
jgi:ABC-type Mn2+/Zn2+ transport system ATPase subunit